MPTSSNPNKKRPGRAAGKRASRPSDSAAARTAAQPGLATVLVLKTLMGHFGSALSTLKDTFGAPPVLDRKPTWRSHIPQLARAGADMIDLEPRLFTWLPFSAAALRNLEAEVLALTEAKSFLDGLTLFCADLLSARRDELYRKTSELTSGLVQGIESPLTPAETRRRLEEISEAVLALVEEQNSALRSARAANKSRVAEASADVERLEQENALLRGEAPVRLSAPRRARRNRR